jgi:hypothetical protein
VTLNKEERIVPTSVQLISAFVTKEASQQRNDAATTMVERIGGISAAETDKWLAVCVSACLQVTLYALF